MKWIFLLLITLNIATYGQKNIVKSFSWKSIDDFPKSWVMLERDTNGYLIYDPCDGNTPAIEIHNDTLLITGQLEGTKHLITKFTVNEKDSSYHLSVQDEISDDKKIKTPSVEIDVLIKDRARKLVLWKWGDGLDSYKMVMTPLQNESFLRKVNNPCPHEKIKEKKFLPVEFD